VSLPIETITNVLNHRPSNNLPRGELFINRDFLDRYFYEDEGEYTKQLERAARCLDLSLIGVSLDAEWPGSFPSGMRGEDLQQYFIVGCMNGPISRLIEKHGFLDAMRSIRNDPSLFSNIARNLIKDIETHATLAHTNGFSAIAITDDIAGNQGLFFSYDYFRETVFPVYKEISTIIKGNDLFAFFHSDGDTRKMIHSLIDAGYDCLHPIDTLAGLNLYELKNGFGERVSFMGHIDPITWNEEQISQEINRAENEFRKGGLILGSTCGLSMETASDKLGILYPKWEKRPPHK
jgi:uroporphyrinogen decarboxylase